MNVWAKLDKPSVLGYFRGLNTTDPLVLRNAYTQAVGGIDLCRKLLIIPLVLGIIQAIGGVIGLLIIVGVFLFIPAAIFGGGAWWLRKRLAENKVVIDAAYAEHVATLGPAPAEPAPAGGGVPPALPAQG